jgi:glycosyltransferase involved in cell wall biosynthesis
MMGGPNIICLRHHFDHMGNVSGIDLLPAAMESIEGVRLTSIWPANPSRLGQTLKCWTPSLFRMLKGIKHLSSAPVTLAWHNNHIARTDRAIRLLREDPAATLILMHTEGQFDSRYLKLAPSEKRRIVLVVHQPPAWYRLNTNNLSIVDGFGGIICLSDSQKDFFSAATNSPVIKILHGVDHEFFTPCAIQAVSYPRKFLFVGHWLRDFNQLLDVISRCWKQDPSIALDCVIPSAAREHPALYELAKKPQVNWYSNLSDERLRERYREASALLLPLVDATANNAMVEALSCGLPVIVTNIGGTPDYFEDGCGALIPPGDSCRFAHEAMKLMNNPNDLIRAKNKARKFALDNLRWTRIAENFVEALKKLETTFR